MDVKDLIKRFKIERYSPLRKRWIDYNESFENKKLADERIVTLAYRHRREPNMKFRIVAVDFDPQASNKEAAAKSKKTLKATIQGKIKDLHYDPKKEEIKVLTQQLKELKEE